MKKLKRLKLHSAVVLQEKEMKAVQGGWIQPGRACNPNATGHLTCSSALLCSRGIGGFGHCQWNAGRGVCTCEGPEEYIYDYGYYPGQPDPYG